MADYYAWSNIQHGKGVVKPGTKVSASDLGVPQEEFDAMVESGAIRTTPYPQLPEGFSGSPREFRLAQLHAESRGVELQQLLDDNEALAGFDTTGVKAKDEQSKK